MIEKTLGEAESIVVASETIVAFTEGIRFEAVNRQVVVVGSGMVLCKGPGVVYIEGGRGQQVAGGAMAMLQPTELTR